MESKPTFFTNGTCTLTIDLETGERRRSVKEDLVKTAILTDALEGMHGYYPFVVPSDYPGYLHGLHELEASLKLHRKTCYARFNINAGRGKTTN